MELVCVGPLEPVVGGGSSDVWCDGHRLRYDRARNEWTWTLGTCRILRRLGLGPSSPSPSSSSAVFTKFEDELCACVFLNHNASCHSILVASQSGKEWEISLPFAARQMWPCCAAGGGLLVERPPHPGLLGEPFLFSIRHPLEEPKPVDFTTGQQRRLQQVAWVSSSTTASPALVLIYALNERVHTLWSLSAVIAPTHHNDTDNDDTDDDDDEIAPEVALTLVRRVDEFNGPLSRCFTCTGWGGDAQREYLCGVLLGGRKLVGVPIATDATSSFALEPVLDALPVKCDSSSSGSVLLVLREHNQLELYRAGSRLCGVPFAASQRRVVRFDAADDGSVGSFDLVFGSSTSREGEEGGGETKSRVVLSVLPLDSSSQATRMVLQAGSEANGEFGVRLRVSIALCFGDVGASDQPTAADTEWDAAVRVLQELWRQQQQQEHEEEEPQQEEQQHQSWFDALLCSQVHAKHDLAASALFTSPAPCAASRTATPPPLVSSSSSSWELFSVTRRTWVRFFDALHAQYQDAKLNVRQCGVLVPVASLLCGLVSALSSSSSSAYADMYARDLAVRVQPVQFTGSFGIISGDDDEDDVAFPPPDIMRDLQRAMTRDDHHHQQYVWKESSAAGRYHAVFACLRQPTAAAVVQEMARQRITLRDVADLPFGVQLVLREVLHRARNHPNHIVAATAKEEEDARAMAVLIGREDWYLSSSSRPTAPTTTPAPSSFPNDLAALLARTRLRFAQDHRVKDVYRMLNGAQPPVVMCERKPGMTDHDLIKVQQAKLHRLVSAGLASSVGRGALLLYTRGSTSTSSSSATAAPIFAASLPALAKSGLVPPQNVSLTLDDQHQFRYSWPAFHNGVAGALSRTSYHQTSSSSSADATTSTAAALAQRDLTRSWILFNKPKSGGSSGSAKEDAEQQQLLMDTHAGVLLAWGLNGDLALLTLADTYEHLEAPHELTSIGLLLGLGAARAGTCDANVRKTLTLHVPALFPAEFSELDVVPVTVQCAAITGLGLLYRGTCNRLMCEFLLEEMAKTMPSGDAGQHVEHQAAYVLSAGLALGHVALGLGAVPGGLAGLGDLHVEDRLHVLISGGGGGGARSSLLVQQQQHLASSSSSVGATAAAASSTSQFDVNDLFAGGGGGGGGGGAGRHRASSTSTAAGGAGTGGVGANAVDAKCARVLEGHHVNTDLTAPGATLALGLIYLKSNDESVRNRLAPPATRFLLENIRPDLLLHRVWAGALVMWDSVEPTLAWVHSHVPAVVVTTLQQQQEEEEVDAQDAKYFAQCRDYILAGACLGLGFRFLGSASQPARDCLLSVYAAATAASGTSSSSSSTATLLACVCTALGLVMAGTGDLDSLRVVRSFVKHVAPRLPAHRRFGAAQLGSQAMGFLLLGAGRRSFQCGRNQAVAALVHAVFPRACAAAEDNTQYLQALRHLYVLASEERVVETVDLETGEECFTPLVITLKSAADAQVCGLSCAPAFGDFAVAAGGSGSELAELAPNQIRVVAPALLPRRDTVLSITVASPRYWPYTMPPGSSSSSCLSLVVQLRADQLTYAADPQGFSSLQARPRPRAVQDLVGTLREFAARQPVVLALAKHEPASFHTLYRCMVQHSLDALPSLLELDSIERRRRISPLEAEQVRVLKHFYSSQSGEEDTTRLVTARAMLLLSEVGGEVDADKLRRYLAGAADGEGDEACFYSALNLRGVPKLGEMKTVSDGGQRRAVGEEALVELLDSMYGG